MKQMLFAYFSVFTAAYFTTVTMHTLFLRTLQSQPGGTGFNGSGLEWTFLYFAPPICLCLLVASIINVARLQFAKTHPKEIEPNVS